MTMADARFHPWLVSCRPRYTVAQRRAMTRSPSPEFVSTNASMLSLDGNESFRVPGEDAGMSQGLEDMQLQDPASDGAHLQTNGIRREGSRTAPLRRRSVVLSQVAEGEGGVLPEPSWEMIQNAAAYVESVAGPSNSNGNGRSESDAPESAVRGNKRVHSELTPVPEDGESDTPATPLADANAVSGRKKGKGVAGEAAGGKSGRGKGRGLAASAPPSGRALRSRAMGQKEDAMSEDDEMASGPKPRRSARQTPQKVARRG
jgi:hypothetical protein